MEFLRDAYRAFQERRNDPRNIEIRTSGEDLQRVAGCADIISSW